MTSLLTAEEQALLDRIPEALLGGTELLRWWLRTDAAGSYARTYKESYVFNRPEDRSFGFFDKTELSTGPTPLNGNVQEMFYDEPKAPRGNRAGEAEWMAEQVREFVLHYFLRVSDFRQPQQVPEPHLPAPPGLGFFSQCPREPAERLGFGFQQLYHQTPEGDWRRFRESRRDPIVDLRRVGVDIGTLVLRNPIYDFKFAFKPFGDQGPQLALPLSDFNYLVLSRDFVVDETRPEQIGRASCRERV